MRDNGPDGRSEVQNVREAYRRAREQIQHQEEALEVLKRLLSDFAEENLRLHRRTGQVLRQMNKQMQEFRRRLKRLTTART